MSSQWHWSGELVCNSQHGSVLKSFWFTMFKVRVSFLMMANREARHYRITPTSLGLVTKTFPYRNWPAWIMLKKTKVFFVNPPGFGFICLFNRHFVDGPWISPKYTRRSNWLAEDTRRRDCRKKTLKKTIITWSPSLVIYQWKLFAKSWTIKPNGFKPAMVLSGLKIRIEPFYCFREKRKKAKENAFWSRFSLASRIT